MKNFHHLPLLTFTLLLLLSACTPINSKPQPPTTTPPPKENLSTPNQSNNCNLEKYNMDCEIVKFFEEKLAWTTEKTGVDFCAYAVLGKEGELIYAQASCSEYYVQAEKTDCPDEEAAKECFSAKDNEKKACQEKCRTEKVSPRLVAGSGVFVPVKITKEKGGFVLWQPRDGSLYGKDLKENFPKKTYSEIEKVDGGLLQAINIERAEKHFGVKVDFEVSGEIGKDCEDYADCGQLSGEYALQSNCPHTLKCLDGRCVAGCYRDIAE